MCILQLPLAHPSGSSGQVRLSANITPAFWSWSNHYEAWSVTVARSFRLLYNGRPLGNHYSLGDLANQDDLFFYLFGAYEYPVEVRQALMPSE